MSEQSKEDRYEWACAEIRKAIVTGVYGSLTFNMQDVIIASMETKTHAKPYVDKRSK